MMPFMQVQQAIQEFHLVGVISDKNFFEIKNEIKVNSSRILCWVEWSIAKSSVQNITFFL